jgi:hypothetical protein
MIDRAIYLRDALTLYQSHDDVELYKDNHLTREDWDELADLNQLLKPIHEVSMHVQSVGTQAGALHNTLTSMDYLLTYLETRRNQPGSSHFMVCFNLGWKKLQKYYQITDLNPSYIMAVFLNPHYRQMWFEDHWQPAFVKHAMTEIKEQYHAAERLYNIDAQSSSISPTQPKKELTGFAAYNKRSSRNKQPADELARYMAATELPDDADPLQWWLLH